MFGFTVAIRTIEGHSGDSLSVLLTKNITKTLGQLISFVHGALSPSLNEHKFKLPSLDTVLPIESSQELLRAGWADIVNTLFPCRRLCTT